MMLAHALFALAQAAAPDVAGADAKIAAGDHALFDEQNDAASYNKALAAYDEADKLAPPRAETYGKRAEAWLRLGDLLTDKEQKRDRYKKGQEAAEAGLALDKRCARCHFWRGANLGRWGEQKGVLNALFLLDDVKGEFEAALKIDPGYGDAKLALGKIDQMVPGFAGGSKERAEKCFREVMTADPHFDRPKLDLAELLADDDREDEARKLAQAVLDEKAPKRPGEHKKFDVPRARQLLQKLAGG